MTSSLSFPFRASLFKTLFFSILCLLASSACGGGGGGDSEPPFTQDPCLAIGLKIANGKDCSIGTNPHASPLVRLTIYEPGGYVGTCSGVVISDKAVLTAGHCLEDGYLSITVGTFAGSSSASSVVVHPEFDTTDFYQGGVIKNDVAIVFVAHSLGVNTAPILHSQAPFIGEEVVIAGFGETSPGGDYGTIVAGNAFVSQLSTQSIAISYQGDQSHPCSGDSGGPMLINVSGRQAVAGIVSQSAPGVDLKKVCEPGDVSLYTNLEDPQILNFITQHVSNASLI